MNMVEPFFQKGENREKEKEKGKEKMQEKLSIETRKEGKM